MGSGGLEPGIRERCRSMTGIFTEIVSQARDTRLRSPRLAHDVVVVPSSAVEPEGVAEGPDSASGVVGATARARGNRGVGAPRDRCLRDEVGHTHLRASPDSADASTVDVAGRGEEQSDRQLLSTCAR